MMGGQPLNGLLGHCSELKLERNVLVTYTKPLTQVVWFW